MAKVDLRTIGREIRKTQAKLKKTRRSVTAADQKKIDALIKKLEGLYKTTVSSCPKSMGGWSPRAVAPKKPRAKR